ncbi:hypothetical protein CFN78_19835 [Amycolatopsis antarctica]|uniref:Uncharacterized protein n=1 Tax=Amycolatopsis antarctica TaxID=1854586 RepID=A0A263CZ82_9PSEU|nr:hypothetical protein [Amycolatopsis antarctica]OZM71411.1 hypothetical protein CFN78_19835 [Amycolatopsis antarctica]
MNGGAYRSQSSVLSHDAAPSVPEPRTEYTALDHRIRDILADIEASTAQFTAYLVNVNTIRLMVTIHDRETFGFDLAITGGEEHVVRTLADRLQDHATERFHHGTPLVPGTNRQAAARIRGGTACWADPTTTWCCPIGRHPAGAKGHR